MLNKQIKRRYILDFEESWEVESFDDDLEISHKKQIKRRYILDSSDSWEVEMLDDGLEISYKKQKKILDLSKVSEDVILCIYEFLYPSDVCRMGRVNKACRDTVARYFNRWCILTPLSYVIKLPFPDSMLENTMPNAMTYLKKQSGTVPEKEILLNIEVCIDKLHYKLKINDGCTKDAIKYARSTTDAKHSVLCVVTRGHHDIMFRRLSYFVNTLLTGDVLVIESGCSIACDLDYFCKDHKIKLLIVPGAWVANVDLLLTCAESVMFCEDSVLYSHTHLLKNPRIMMLIDGMLALKQNTLNENCACLVLHTPKPTDTEYTMFGIRHKLPETVDYKWMANSGITWEPTVLTEELDRLTASHF